MSDGGRFTNSQPENNENKKPKTGGFAKVLITLGVILVLVAAAVLGVTVYNYTMVRMSANKPTVPTLATEPVAVTEAAVETVPAETEIETEPTETTLPYTPSGKDIINVLLIGDSSREGETAKLSDTIILASINKPAKTVTLTSFLRDTYVDLPDYLGHTCGWNRINVAYNLGYNWGGQAGGMEMTNITLKNNFGVEVDYNVEINFDGVIDSIDLLGGVPMELTEAEAKYMNNYLNKALGYDAFDYKAVYDDGSTYSFLYGWQCLTYARMRHSDASDSDIKRTERQRKLIAAVIDQIKGSDLNTLMDFAKQILQNVTTDMTDDEILTCMWEVLPMLADLKIESQVMPAEGTYWSKEFMVGEYLTYVLEFDAKKNREIMTNIAEADQLAVQPVG